MNRKDEEVETTLRPQSFSSFPGQEKVTYCYMTPEKAVKVVVDHIVNNKPVTEYIVK